MAKYRILVREDRFIEFIFQTDQPDPEKVAEEFLELSEEDQKRFLVSSDCFTWDVEAVERT